MSKENKTRTSEGEEEKPAHINATRRGRPPKPVDVYSAIELIPYGASLREQARQAGCSPQTLTKRYAEALQRAEARLSVFLKIRLFQLAHEHNSRALLFLSKRMMKGEQEGGWKRSRREFFQAMGIVLRSSQPKPKRRPRKRKSPFPGGQ